jgi:hypothetical protein
MTKQHNASKVKMDRVGRFHLAGHQDVLANGLKDVNLSSDALLKDPKLALPMRDSSTPVAKYSGNLLFTIMIAIACIALSQTRKKSSGVNPTLDDGEDMYLSDSMSAQAPCKVHKALKPPTKPTDTSGVNEPGVRLPWPIHLPLKRIGSFSTVGEIKTMMNRNCPEPKEEPTPADKQQRGSEWAKKSVRWSQSISVHIVDNLHLEGKGVEWEGYTSSYWYDQLTAVPELQFQKYRMRIRREMQQQPTEMQWTPPSPPITSKARTRSC